MQRLALIRGSFLLLGRLLLARASLLHGVPPLQLIEQISPATLAAAAPRNRTRSGGWTTLLIGS